MMEAPVGIGAAGPRSGNHTAPEARRVAGGENPPTDSTAPGAPENGSTLGEFLRRVRPQLEHAAEATLELSQAASARPVSCAKGCGACCRQLVTISPAEAFDLADWMETWPEERREAVRGRAAIARAKLETAGVWAELDRLGDPALTDEDHYQMAARHFAAGAACPFLEDESCSIHARRPLACREYAVVSRPEICSRPFAVPGAVERLPLRESPAAALRSLCAQLLGTPPEGWPLVVIAAGLALGRMEGEGAAGTFFEEARNRRFDPAKLTALLELHLELSRTTPDPAGDSGPVDAGTARADDSTGADSRPGGSS